MRVIILSVLSSLVLAFGSLHPQEGVKTYLSVHLSFNEKPEVDSTWNYMKMTEKDVQGFGLRSLKTLLSEQLPPKMLQIDIKDELLTRSSLEKAKDSSSIEPFAEKGDRPAWICWISDIQLTHRPKSRDDRRIYLNFDYTMFNNQTLKISGNGHVEVVLDSMSVKDFTEYMMMKIAYPILQNIPSHDIVQAQRIAIKKDSVRHEYFQVTRFYVNGIVPTYAKGASQAGEYFNLELGSIEIGAQYLNYDGYSYGLEIGLERAGQGAKSFAHRPYEEARNEQLRMQSLRLTFGWHRLWMSSLESHIGLFAGTARLRTYSDYTDTRVVGEFNYPILYGGSVGIHYFPIKKQRIGGSLSLRFSSGSATLSKFDTGESGASPKNFSPGKKSLRLDNIQLIMGITMDVRLTK